MTRIEFSDAFSTSLNSHNTQAQFGEQASKNEIVLDEYEKSFFLTKAQKELVINLYNGKNPFGDSFESTEELRRYLDGLIKTEIYKEGLEEINIEENPNKLKKLDTKGISPNSTLFKLPDDLAFITMEQVTYGDDTLGCYNGSVANVYPVTQDEYSRVKNNPFRGPTKYKVIRLDAGDNTVELISKYKINSYLIKYLAKPSPIILETLPNNLTIEGVNEATDCKLNPILHTIILDRAVRLALQAKSISIDK